MPYILEAHHTVRNDCYHKRFSTEEALCRYLREDCGWSAARICDLLYLGEPAREFKCQGQCGKDWRSDWENNQSKREAKRGTNGQVGRRRRTLA